MRNWLTESRRLLHGQQSMNNFDDFFVQFSIDRSQSFLCEHFAGLICNLIYQIPKIIIQAVVPVVKKSQETDISRSILFIDQVFLFLAILVVYKVVLYYFRQGFVFKTYHQLDIFDDVVYAHVLPDLHPKKALAYFYLYEKQQFIVVDSPLFASLRSLIETKWSDLSILAGATVRLEATHTFDLSRFLHSRQVLVQSNWGDFWVNRDRIGPESFREFILLINN